MVAPAVFTAVPPAFTMIFSEMIFPAETLAWVGLIDKPAAQLCGTKNDNDTKNIAIAPIERAVLYNMIFIK